ncbi:PKD domain-containing protein [Phycicoccus sp. MQZ13P-5]|uniref:PKD domain-containing protein n=2 Tax=Phycicoccus sonneratiae TaxID=2807628 RepID=A0ABS2CQB3_9MICO|nr:PKD domain-containing protein [Phycicoccus sonneraticus]
MRAFSKVSDGTVNIDFSHVVENPLVNGIEIVRTDVTPTPPTDGLVSVPLTSTGTSGSPRAESTGGVSWASTRGAFMVGSTVFYGSTDGFLHRRTFNGTTFGTDVQVNPYNDPKWKDVDNNLGGTYNGAVPSLYGQMNSVSGMTYSAGWMYYTLNNDSRLLARWFSPDSGIMDERIRTVSSSVNFADANGMFVSGGKLYYVRKADGALYSVAFDGSSVSGSPTKVSGSGVDGIDWRNRSMFLYGGPPANEPPTAAIGTPSCTFLACDFAGSGTDTDGTIAGYSWSFGDGGTSTAQNPSHTYTAAGTYTVTLTVTDDDGATGTTTRSVTVAAQPANVPPTASFTSSCTDGSCSFDGTGSSDPDGTIASYAWTFGDGGTATTASPTHEYAESGTYSVGLTVTDNRGGTGTTTKSVTVTVPTPTNPLSFVGAASSAAGSAKFKAATVPATTQVGDTMLLWLTTPSTVTWTGPSGVTGWTQVDSFVNGTIRSTLWRKQAEAGDAGKSVRVDDPSGFRLGNLSVAVYRNVAATGVTATRSGDSATATHTTPTGTAQTGDWVVSYWSDKSSATSNWTLPGSVSSRLEQTDASGTYRFSVLAADSGGPVAAGQVGGVTATSNATSDKTAMWTVVLHPVG